MEPQNQPASTVTGAGTGAFLDALASLETTQVGESVSEPQFRRSHSTAL